MLLIASAVRPLLEERVLKAELIVFATLDGLGFQPGKLVLATTVPVLALLVQF
jgi:hypothetical protein